MSQAANTIWINRPGPESKASAIASRSLSSNRVIDALVLMVFLASVAICFSIYVRSRAELSQAATKQKVISAKVEELKVETERLRRDVERLKTDPEMIESYARQKLGMVRAGDVVIKIGSTKEN